jgi:hypothetical protein
MKKLVLAGLVAASVLVGNVSAAGWKVPYTSDVSGGKAYRIECSNGKTGSAIMYFNDDRYYTNGGNFTTLDEAANSVCN